MGTLSHLDELEAEAIYIMREVAAECEKPVMLYSIGKDSSVMLHLAMKAFYPEKPPFPFMHIDKTWKFKEMIEFRDKIAKEKGISRMSAQAVGGAVGHNEISIIIPCHRVVGTNGSLTGYAGGIDKKIALLKLEHTDMSYLFVPKKGTAL